MIGDDELPNGWIGSYGTLNTRQALAEIHARLQALETERTARYGQNSAVMIIRRPSGRFYSSHITVYSTAPLDKDAALDCLRSGRKLVFVKPMVAGAVLDALEAHGEQAQ